MYDLAANIICTKRLGNYRNKESYITMALHTAITSTHYSCHMTWPPRHLPFFSCAVRKNVGSVVSMG